MDKIIAVLTEELNKERVYNGNYTPEEISNIIYTEIGDVIETIKPLIPDCLNQAEATKLNYSLGYIQKAQSLPDEYWTMDSGLVITKAINNCIKSLIAVFNHYKGL